MNSHFIEPLDVLFLRGNKLFGEAGSYGEAMVPPWPSVAAGAMRSAILIRDAVDPLAFARGERPHDTLGTPAEPGGFRVCDFQLSWHGHSGQEDLEAVYPVPADLVVTEAGSSSSPRLLRLTPHRLPPGIACSSPTAMLPVLAQSQRRKPAGGYWLTEAGMQAWLDGMLPDAACHLVPTGSLWHTDERVGIGMENATRRAGNGQLFTTQGIVLGRGVGFRVVTDGDGLEEGTWLRFGGDGRGAVVRRVASRPPWIDPEALLRHGRCRVVLTTPGLFPDGWRLPGMAPDGAFDLAGVRGRVVAAVVPRAETLSGWDLARGRPKTAQRAAPAGSVYWLEELDASPEALAKLANRGLWPDSGYDRSREVEGFNRFLFAAY